MKTFNSNV